MERRHLSVVLVTVLLAWPAVGPCQSSSTAQGSGQEGPQQGRRWLVGAEEPIAPTEISADLGGCSALITVTGSDSKPIFNSKVSTRIRYGLFGAKKLDLEVYTSASGQVKIVGLPESPKRPIFFQISKGERYETVEFNPDAGCHANFNVRLK
jgi:hypothetical protein